MVHCPRQLLHLDKMAEMNKRISKWKSFFSKINCEYVTQQWVMNFKQNKLSQFDTEKPS